MRKYDPVNGAASKMHVFLCDQICWRLPLLPLLQKPQKLQKLQQAFITSYQETTRGFYCYGLVSIAVAGLRCRARLVASRGVASSSGRSYQISYQ